MYEWIEAYQNGLSTYQIADKYNTNPQRVRRRLRKLGVKLRSTSEAMTINAPTEKIIADFDSGMSARKIAAKYNYTITGLTDLLKRHSRNVQTPKTKADWSFIHNDRAFFLYWLGWMLTDGCINYRRAGGRNRGIVISFSTQSGDRHVAEYFRSRIYPACTIVEINCNAVQLSISIPRTDAHCLGSWGFTPRKSRDMHITANLQTLTGDDFWQFLTGVIEGDGCVTRNGTVEVTSGSKPWLEFISKRLISMGLSSHSIGNQPRSKQPMTSKQMDYMDSFRLRIHLGDSAIIRNKALACKYHLLTRKWLKPITRGSSCI